MADKNICAHYVSTYLPLTENWIYRSVKNLKAFYPITLCRKKKNLDLFPIDDLYSLSDRNLLLQLLEIAYFRIIGYFIFMKRLCVTHNVSILHIHFGYHGVKSLGLKKKLRVPMICSFYGDDAFSHPLKKGVKKKYKTLFNKAEAILVLGPYMKNALMQLGCEEEKLHIHHLGIDVEKILFKKKEIDNTTSIRFLIASSFLEKKGIDLAIKALSRIRNEFDFTLDIIGDGPLKNDLINLISEVGLNNQVVLHGYKPYDYFIALASKSHVFIQASRTAENNNKEGTPMAIVDAMATGMAVVSTKHSDIPEIVKDGVHGYLADENDLQSLTEALRNILLNKISIGSMGEAGRWHIEKEFNAQVQAQKLEQLYSNVIAEFSKVK